MASRIAEEIRYLKKVLADLKPLIIRAEQHEAMLVSNLEDVRNKAIMYSHDLQTVRTNLREYIERYKTNEARLKYLTSEEVSQSRITFREIGPNAQLPARRY